MSAQLTISMFNVGFGDCFLLQIPLGSKTCRILFDCGRHLGGTTENQALADEVIMAAKDGAGPVRIDLVVATHRHKDHVSGFGVEGWDQVQVAEVWMPWTENPGDTQARGLVDRQIAAARAVRAAFAAAPGLNETQTKLAAVVDLALTNEAAMDTLYHGFLDEPVRRYLPDDRAPTTPLTLAGFPGLRFHVMGPPRDEAAMGVMDPPKAETFKRLAAAASGASNDKPLSPFGPAWRADEQSNPLLPGADQAKIAGLSDDADLEGLAALIDNAINNTSLVIMVEIGSAFLLFCADAQWGNWRSILAQPHWRELLGRTTFLKVGHHASHNASPVTLVNTLLPDQIPAMVSVDPNAYHNVPFGGLLDAFQSKHFKVARSDMPAEAVGYTADDRVTTLTLPF